MEFTEADKQWWQAKDAADTYDIFLRKTVYLVFKDEKIWLATAQTLEEAKAACETERQEQRWLSNNPENADKYAVHRAARDAQRATTTPSRHYPRKQPKLYRGKRRHHDPCTKPSQPKSAEDIETLESYPPPPN